MKFIPVTTLTGISRPHGGSGGFGQTGLVQVGLHSGVKHEEALTGLLGEPHTGHLLVNEGTEHVTLKERGVEWPVLSGLVRQKGCLVEILELFAISDPLVIRLRGDYDEVVVVGKVLHEVS